MIAFGCPVTDRTKYTRFAQPGMMRAGEPGSPILLRHDASSIQQAYNSMLNEAAALGDLEALVLLHQDVELRDERLGEKLRAWLRDPLVAVVGAIGAPRVHALDYWREGLIGGVAWPALGQAKSRIAGSLAAGTVEAVDGLLMVLSPWAVRTLRFDERFAPFFHGYDVDLCFQARERGRRVVVANLDVVHHAVMDFFDRRTWIPAYQVWHSKWGSSPVRPPQSS